MRRIAQSLRYLVVLHALALPAEPAALPVFPVTDVEATLGFWKEKVGVDLRAAGESPLPPSSPLADGGRGLRLLLAEDAALGVRLLLVAGVSRAPAQAPAQAPIRACIRIPEVGPVRAKFPGAQAAEVGDDLYLFLADPDGNRFCVAGPRVAPLALFNGRDLEGWHEFRNASWRVEDGLLVGEQGPNNAGGWLVTDGVYGDFTLTLEFRISEGANSGVCVRYPGEGPPPKTGAEIQFCEVDPEYQTGAILGVETAPRGLYTPGWNRASVIVEGTLVVSSLNGKEAARARIDRLDPKGHVALQVHGGPDYTGTSVEFRNVRLLAR